MRPFEWLISATSILGIVWFLQSRLPSSPLWFGIAAAILLLLHAWLEGMHWQMGPAYVALPLTLFAGLAGPGFPVLRLCCAIMAGAMVAASLALSWVMPMFKLPAPTGRYPVGTRTLHLHDPSRVEMHAGARPGTREVVVQLWYPAAMDSGPRAKYRLRSETSRRSSYQSVLAVHSLQDAPLALGRFPVILHNPAWHGLRHSSTFIIQDLASHGFVVAAISHPYNSSMVTLSDGTTAHPDLNQDIGYSKHHHIPYETRIALAEEELVVQTRDCRFVLDELQRFDQTAGHPLEAHLQMDCVGAQGVSYGGAVALQLAREDARVRSAVELDGVVHGSVALHGLDKPFMFLDCPLKGHPFEAEEGADVRAIETAGLWQHMFATKDRLLSDCGGVRVLVDGIGKADFYDQIFMSPLRKLTLVGSVPRKRVARILNSYIVAFYQQTLLGRPSSLFSHGAKDFPEVTVEEWRPCVK
jgi:predicted dienelactone hydrolase